MVYVGAQQRERAGSDTGEQPLSLAFLRKRTSSGSSTEEVSPPRLVRKKSGELVKSSLRLDALSKSVPTTPTYNKSVHFGNAVDVRYFDGRERPTAVSADGSPRLRGRGTASFEGLENCSDTDDDDEDEDGMEVTWDLQLGNFEKVRYQDKFRSGASIFLEKLVLEGDSISGTLAVKNLAFQKDVHVRYSFDQWQTVIEIEATFSSDAPRILKRANFDRFHFKIGLSKFVFLPTDRTEILFCIRYRYNQKEVWDNNGGKNYRCVLTRERRRRGSNRTKFSLNDYLNGMQASMIESEDYFGNYETSFRSPATPAALRHHALLDTPQFPSLDIMVERVPQLSLKDDKAKENIEPNRQLLHYTTDSNRPKNQPNFTTATTSSSNNTITKRNRKPPMNSKSYQELLDSYCFFTSDSSTDAR